MPGKPFRILSICDDDGIRFSRELVLRHQGYEVESALSTDFLAPERVLSCHVAVLCHTISSSRAMEITEYLRRINPSIAVLRVHIIRSAPDRLYDADCEVFPGPAQLLEGIRTLHERFDAPAADVGRRKSA